MKILVNIEEVFSMAVHMESNAIDFYQKAAHLQTSKENSMFLERLATVETGHKKTFMEFRNAIRSAKQPEDELDSEGALFLSAIASGYRAEGASSALHSIAHDTSLDNILRIGIELEKQAVLFYIGLQDLFPSRTHRKTLQQIINEEKSHIAELARKRSRWTRRQAVASAPYKDL